jgi:hypothetical protein
MRLVRFALVDERQHRAPKCLRPADFWIAGHVTDGDSDQLDSGVRVDFPVRDQQGPGLCVNEA